MCKQCEWGKKVEKIEEIIEKLDDLPDRALEFREGVEDRLRSMLEWINKNKHITPNMESAIDNIEDGVNRWLGD